MDQNQNKPKSSESIEKHVYPEAKLSDKQLAALHSVIGPATKKDSTDKAVDDIIRDTKSGDLSADNLQNIKLDPEPRREPVSLPEIEMKDRTIIKTVFLIIFIVLFVAAAAVAGFYYWWTTHATFEHTLHPVVILDGQNVTPEDFLYPSAEMEDVTAEFINPDFDPFVGMQYVSLTLSLGLRTVDTAAALYVLTPLESIEHEFAEEAVAFRAVDLLANPEVAANVPFDVYFTETPKPLEEYEVGEHVLHLALNDVPFTVMLNIVDTTAPVALSVPVYTIIGEEVHPEQFVTEVFDASGISSIVFENEPDIFLASADEQDVTIAIEDNNGNRTVITSTLTLELNQLPPVIEGVPEIIESKTGNQIDYLAGVSAHDDFEREIEVTVTDIDVDINTLGTYTAIISATDFTGNTTEVEVTVHIISVDPDELAVRLREILSGITNNRMTQVDIARAVQKWVMSNITKSTSASSSDSVLEVAYQALERKQGNSFANSAVASALLTEAGVPNMLITRIESAAESHRWVLINPDDKGWHHFDAFRSGIVSHNSVSYMFTDAAAKAIAARIKTNLSIDDYYTYNTEMYPDIVKE
ncbi:MAG: hypothetical protein FWD38_00615 [Oscillospiraceae bacterium]|nr:hypothetical protein [Oscillospiraceae bacterium]